MQPINQQVFVTGRTGRDASRRRAARRRETSRRASSRGRWTRCTSSTARARQRVVRRARGAVRALLPRRPPRTASTRCSRRDTPAARGTTNVRADFARAPVARVDVDEGAAGTRRVLRTRRAGLVAGREAVRAGRAGRADGDGAAGDGQRDLARLSQAQRHGERQAAVATEKLSDSAPPGCPTITICANSAMPLTRATMLEPRRRPELFCDDTFVTVWP